jgi:hypothetical protein
MRTTSSLHADGVGGLIRLVTVEIVYGEKFISLPSGRPEQV